MSYLPRSSPSAHPDLDRVLDALNASEAVGLRDAWDLADLARPESDPVVEADVEARVRTERVLDELTRVRVNGTSSGGRAPDRTPARRPRVARRFTVWTPLALGVVMVSVWFGMPITHQATPGEYLDVRLPDGSVVTLNSGSTLRHARLFGAMFTARTMRLEGEAFFDVEPSEVPFVVRTFDARVTVLGTEFGVRAWADEPEGATTVALVSGRVRLTPEGRQEASAILDPDDVRTVREGVVLDAKAASTSDALAWRQGDLVYKDRPLAVVLQDVERRFGVGVTPQPALLGDRRVSVALRAPDSAETVVRDLATAFGLRYRASADGFELVDPMPSASPSR